MTSNKDGMTDYGRSRRDGDATREALEQALALAVQIDRLLTSPPCTSREVDTFRIRLARAHTLSLLDQLAELINPLESTTRLASRDDEEGPSGIRFVWR